jgi:hypothetical protein
MSVKRGATLNTNAGFKPAGRTDYKSMFQFFRDARLFWEPTDGRRDNILYLARARMRRK